MAKSDSSPDGFVLEIGGIVSIALINLIWIICYDIFKGVQNISIASADFAISTFWIGMGLLGLLDLAVIFVFCKKHMIPTNEN
jgi:hypothetical protein